MNSKIIMTEKHPPSSSSPASSAVIATQTCPICAKATMKDYRPFCSKHCADVDLGRWFQQRYAVATQDSPQREEDVDAFAE